MPLQDIIVGSMCLTRIELILTTLQFPEKFVDFWMLDRLARIIGD